MSHGRRRSVAYLAYNQTRIARYANSFLQIYQTLDECPTGRHWKRSQASAVDYIKMSLYRSLITHLYMIKDRRGASLYYLIERAHKEDIINGEISRTLQNMIDKHSKTITKVSRQRNLVAAHRSQDFSFKEVMDQHAISNEELESLANIYHWVAVQLTHYAPFAQPWPLDDVRSDALELLYFVTEDTSLWRRLQEFKSRPKTSSYLTLTIST
jgi:hypothetical protein